MSTIIERFAGGFREVTNEFLSRLDRNFARLAAAEMAIQVVGVNYGLLVTDTIASVQVDATAGALTVALPSSPTGSRRRTITKTDVSVNAVTVSGNGSLINGATTYVLAAQYDSVTVEPTGTGWLVVAVYP